MTSDEETTGDARLQESVQKMSKRMLFVELDGKHSDLGVGDFDYEKLTENVENIDARSFDEVILQHLMKTRLSCQVFYVNRLYFASIQSSPFAITVVVLIIENSVPYRSR